MSASADTGRLEILSEHVRQRGRPQFASHVETDHDLAIRRIQIHTPPVDAFLGAVIDVAPHAATDSRHQKVAREREVADYRVAIIPECHVALTSEFADAFGNVSADRKSETARAAADAGLKQIFTEVVCLRR
ncbi:MAG: hypothetical protein ABIK36_02570 [Pseudomonadota bacterium]